MEKSKGLSTYQGLALLGIGCCFGVLFIIMCIRTGRLQIHVPNSALPPPHVDAIVDAGVPSTNVCTHEQAELMLMAWLNDARRAGGGDPRVDEAVDYALTHGYVCESIACYQLPSELALAQPTDLDDPYAMDADRINFHINCDPEEEAWFNTYDFELLHGVPTLHLPSHSGSYQLVDAIHLARLLYQLQHQTHYASAVGDYVSLPWLETICRNAQAALTSFELERDLYDHASDGALRPYILEDLRARHARGDYSFPTLDDLEGVASIDAILASLPEHASGTLTSAEIFRFYRLEEFENEHAPLGERLSYAAAISNLFGNVPWSHRTLPTQNCP